ncbi:MAG: hypothetical protein ACE5GK_10095 [Nitrospiria bacterium]
MKKRKLRGRTGLKRTFFMLGLLIGVSSLADIQALAAPEKAKAPEMTPGPRMIRAVEALADDLSAAQETLVLTPDQIKRIHNIVADFKKEIWRKEAVLTGMFEKISLKRRHGLLAKGEYQSANMVTGGIESEELGKLKG